MGHRASVIRRSTHRSSTDSLAKRACTEGTPRGPLTNTEGMISAGNGSSKRAEGAADVSCGNSSVVPVRRFRREIRARVHVPWPMSRM